MIPVGEYTPFELGPESKNLSQPTDLDLALRTANYFLGEVRYPEHNQRMLELHEKFDTRTPGMEMTVALHDLVDHGLSNPKDEETKTRVQMLIYDLWERVSDTGQLYYALGCALSQSQIEETVAENWRHAGIEGYSDRPKEEKKQLAAAIYKDDSVKVDEKVLRSAGVYELDTSSIKHAMETQNIEGFINGGIELLDNLRNPPPDSRAVWRDCIEALSCYYSALIFFGAKKLATELRGEALEWFHKNEPEYSKAQEQNRVASRHFNQIEEIFNDALGQSIVQLETERKQDIAMGTIPELKGSIQASSIEQEGRPKTIGSATKKLLSPRYKDKSVELLPDSIGFRIIVPNLLGGVGAIKIGQKMKQVISDVYGADNKEGISIRVAHPHPNEPAEEDYINNPKPSGYKSHHVVFMAEIDGDTVPFEIQTVTQEQEWLHTYAKASEVLRKTDSEPSSSRIDDLVHMGKRSEHLKNKPLNQELIPSTWIDIAKQLPNLNSPVNRTYKLVEKDGARFMVPHEIAGFVSEALEGSEFSGNIFLPPSYLNLEDFKWMVSQLDPTLDNDEQIQNAINLVMSQDLPLRRGGIGQMEGHLLPVAFHAGLMASLSARHWDSKDSSRFLSDTIVIALLHDIIEDIEEEDRGEMRVRIQSLFGDRIADTVDALSSPGHIKNSNERRLAYAKQLEENTMAPFIKLPDRLQNHIVDLVLLANSDPSVKVVNNIKKYFKKTLRYLNPLFTNEKMPSEYSQAYKMVASMAKNLFEEL